MIWNATSAEANCALAYAGAAGVARVLKILRTELMMAMALTGRTAISQVDQSVLWKAT